MKEFIHWPTNTDIQRLFHGRGHKYPGLEHLVVDWFAPVLQITLYDEIDDKELLPLAEVLKSGVEAQGLECEAVVVQFRYLPGSPRKWLHGDEIARLVGEEAGLQYHLELGASQNAGLFLDMALGRGWVKANSKHKRVLNLFSYTCGFSVAAIAGGADFVLNVDMARGALNRGRENHRLNQQDLNKVKFESVDIFKSWGRLKKHGPYDLLICDPPSFQKGSIDIKRDYAKIIKRVPQLMNSGGELILCLNAPELSEAFLHQEVAQHCPECEFVERISTPDVFVDIDPDKALKVLRFRYTGE